MADSVKAFNFPPFPIIPTQAVSGDVTSLVTDTFTKDNVNIQCVWDGTLEGTFFIQTSNDYVPSKNGPSAPPLNPGSWANLPFVTPAEALGTPDIGVFDLNMLSARYLRVVFIYVGGAGNLTATIVGKAI